MSVALKSIPENVCRIRKFYLSDATGTSFSLHTLVCHNFSFICHQHCGLSCCYIMYVIYYRCASYSHIPTIMACSRNPHEMGWIRIRWSCIHPPKTSNSKDTLHAHENRVDSAIMKNELISQSHDWNRLKNIWNLVMRGKSVLFETAVMICMPR